MQQKPNVGSSHYFVLSALTQASRQYMLLEPSLCCIYVFLHHNNQVKCPANSLEMSKQAQTQLGKVSEKSSHCDVTQKIKIHVSCSWHIDCIFLLFTLPIFLAFYFLRMAEVRIVTYQRIIVCRNRVQLKTFPLLLTRLLMSQIWSKHLQ